MECQPISGVPADRLVRQPDRMHRLEQEVARGVAGEHATGPVAAVGGRRKPDNENPGLLVTETRHRPAPVGLVAETGHLLARDLLAPRDQPRAAPALDDLRRQVSKRCAPRRSASWSGWPVRAAHAT